MSLLILAPTAIYLLFLILELTGLLRGRNGYGWAIWRISLAGIALAGALALSAQSLALIAEWTKREKVPFPAQKMDIDDYPGPKASGKPGAGEPGVFWYIHHFSRHYGVDPLLVRAVIEVESEFNPRAVSRTGAKGLMQINPITAQHLGIDNPFDVRENIEGGVRYLRYLLELYGWRLHTALASYNAGPANIQRYQGIPPFLETRRYVSRVVGAYERLKRTERAFREKSRIPPMLRQASGTRAKPSEAAR